MIDSGLPEVRLDRSNIDRVRSSSLLGQHSCKGAGLNWVPILISICISASFHNLPSWCARTVTLLLIQYLIQFEIARQSNKMSYLYDGSFGRVKTGSFMCR